MNSPAADPLEGVRARRLGSYTLDLFFLLAPWAAAGGMAAAPAGGNAESGLAAFAGLIIVCAVASLTMLVLEVVVFVAKGRTLGMAVAGLYAARGVRWLSVFLDPLLGALSLGCAFPVGFVLGGMGDVSDTVATAVLVAIPLLVLVLNFAFVLLPGCRTLTDRMSGLRVVRDGLPAMSPPASRGGAYTVDVIVAAACGAPVLAIAGGSQLVTAALASALMVVVLGAVELVLWGKTGATLGMRVLGVRAAKPAG